MDRSTTKSLRLNEQIMLAIRNARSILRSEMDDVARPFNVTARQMSLLLILHRDPGISAAEMARNFDLDAGMLTRVLDSLHEKHLVSRARCVFDRRVVELSLTELGRHVAEEAAPKASDVLDAKFRRFTKIELERLHGLLEKFLEI